MRSTFLPYNQRLKYVESRAYARLGMPLIIISYLSVHLFLCVSAMFVMPTSYHLGECDIASNAYFTSSLCILFASENRQDNEKTN